MTLCSLDKNENLARQPKEKYPQLSSFSICLRQAAFSFPGTGKLISDVIGVIPSKLLGKCEMANRAKPFLAVLFVLIFKNAIHGRDNRRKYDILLFALFK